jgi:hypothetical protein
MPTVVSVTLVDSSRLDVGRRCAPWRVLGIYAIGTSDRWVASAGNRRTVLVFFILVFFILDDHDNIVFA